MWDQRYGGKEYACGTEPNEFLVAMAPRFLHLQECEREIHEGAFHDGLGAVVQMVGRKP